MPTATKSTKRAAKQVHLTSEHKEAMARGREEGRVVRNYLEALEAYKPRRGRKRTPESIEKRLQAIEEMLSDADPLQRLTLLQDRADLQAELAQMGEQGDLTELETDFCKVAQAYSERKGITYNTWREAGVDPSVLKRAGISRSAG